MKPDPDAAPTLQEDIQALLHRMTGPLGEDDALQLYRRVIEASPDHVSIVSPAYVYKHVNAAYLRAHGLPERDIVGRHVAELLGNDVFRQTVQPNLDRCLAGEEVVYEAWFNFRVTGRKFMHVTYTPLQTVTDRVDGVVVTARDITPIREAQETLRSENSRLEARVLERTRELREANHALRVNEERFRIFYEASPSMYFIVDTVGCVLSANRFGAEHLGYRCEELVGRPVSDIFFEEDRAAASQALTNAFTEPERTHQWRFRKRTKKGDLLWVQETVRSIQEPNGTPVALIVCQDITTQILSETLLRDREQAIRSLQEATSAPGVPFDQRMQTVLELGCRRFGLPVGIFTKVEGDRLEVSHVWPPTGPVKPGTRLLLCRTFCNATLQASSPVGFEHARVSDWARHPGYADLGFECYLGAKLSGQRETYGTICFVGNEPYPGRFTETHFDFLLLMARWISDELDRQAAEHALRQSEERFRQLFEDAPVGMCIMGQDLTIRKVNPAFCRLTGYDDQEIQGQTYARYTHPDDLQKHLELSRRFLGDEIPAYAYETRLVRKNHSLIWVSVTVSPLSFPGSAEKFGVAIVQDITARKLAETTLEHRERELRHALSEREQVSQDLHDGVLQSLYAVGLSLDATGRLVGRSARRAKQELTGAISQLNRTIQEIRSFIAGLSFDHLDVPRFTQVIRTVVGAFCKPGRTQCDITASPEAIRRLARPHCVHLINLVREAVSNSVRHGRATRIRVTLRLQKDRLHLTIRDNGHGFDPDAPLKRGYGLQNMRSRTAKLGGALRIHSGQDSGTRIVVSFTAEEHDDQREAIPYHRPIRGRSRAGDCRDSERAPLGS